MIPGRPAKITRISLFVLLLSLLLSAPTFAQDVSFEFDPGRTTVAYTLGGMLHTVHGTFKLKSGTIHFDSATGAAHGSVVVDATTGDSGNHSRDQKMHKEILESQKYPEITLTPRHVEGKISEQGLSHLEIQGTMNLHGADHDITIMADVQPATGELTADVRFPIPYVKWGIKSPNTVFLRVSPTVDIEIHAVGHLLAEK